LELKWQILFKTRIVTKKWGKTSLNEDEISYRNLRKIQQMEKNSPVLTDLKSSFYKELSDYLEKLETSFKEEPASKQTILKDEIENTKKIATNIYEQREKKVLLSAISKARGGNPDLNRMLEIEKNLYNSILDVIMQSREQILENKTNDNKEKMIDKENKEDTVEVEKKEDDENIKQNTNPIVRVTQDIPEFIGTDTRKYNLRKNDVLSLPRDMSDTLSKRGVAKEIKK